MGLKEPRRKERASATGIVQAMGAARRLQLVATERAEKLSEAHGAGGGKGLSLGLLGPARGYGDGKKAPEFE